MPKMPDVMFTLKLPHGLMKSIDKSCKETGLDTHDYIIKALHTVQLQRIMNRIGPIDD